MLSNRHWILIGINIQHTTYGTAGGSSNSIKGDAERDFFVELWDVSGHERYKDCRSLFYSQINGKKYIILLELVFETNLYLIGITAILIIVFIWMIFNGRRYFCS